MGKQAEEFLAAGIAAIRRETKIALQRNQRTPLDSFTRDVLEIKIPATRAVDVMHERSGDRPGVKPQVACLASPGAQTDQGRKKIADATSA
jgi:hypothetical protein